MIDKIKSSILNIKHKKMDSSIDMKNKMEFNISIYEAEKEKSKLLLELGVLTYEKIRANSLQDNDFENISLRILELDKDIYSKKRELKSIDDNNVNVICECGNSINLENKFCSECGSKIILGEDINNLITCEYCNYEIDSDSNYCPCCGNKKI